ncbi:MAG TPA: amylo-alpha-1,6-glucosidase [Polyangiaceae bacterium]|jgi:predicted glycogen debranching enzyme|nr:amylo-alpha-1,6-glucosidase [Polyangiaceae bacterium]
MKVRPGSDFRPSRDGPWPAIETNGELAPAEREWLHTNGAGAYSMSTIALMHTRRHHGAFVAALPPPLGRHVIISHAETSITPELERRTFRLATHQFPSLAPTPGYRHLSSFAIDPIPRWVFRIGHHQLERTLCLARGKNVLVTGYTWKGRGSALLQVRPLMPLRPVDRLVSEHGGMMQVISMKPGAVEMKPVPSLPSVVFGHEGMFMGSPDWWRRFEYLADQGDGIAFQEDIWTPGVFEMQLDPGRTVYLTAAIGALPDSSPEKLMEEARALISAQDPGEERSESVRALCVAAEQFCLDSAQRPAVIAGYPWHATLVRDWVMAMPGLHLARGRLDLVERALCTLLPFQRGGLLPERLPEAGALRSKPLPDGTLWLFELARELESRIGLDHPLLKEQLYPALVRAFVRLRSRRRRFVWLSADGLLVNGATGAAMTWMDAHVGPALVTPRAGVAIEQQALFVQGANTLARFSRHYQQLRLAELCEQHAETADASFRARFWCDETDYPYDCLSEARDSADAWADKSIRPNALIALAVAPQLFQHWQAAAIIERVRSELLTPRGIRSLSPSDGKYIGQFAGSPEEREVSYHRGTAWTHLLGFYARAAIRLAPDDVDVHYDLRGLLEQAIDDGVLLGQVAQLADGDPPHRPRGCPAQATSVAELLRALVVDLDV